MTVVAHLSDLHFGTTDDRVVQALLDDLHHCRPDVVVISGDLTQRARTHQFQQARAFLDRLPAPYMVVPGNHDLAPLFRPLRRIFSPRDRFHDHLPGHGDFPIWSDPSLLIMGLDSTRHLRWKSGKLRSNHLDDIDQALADYPHANGCRMVFLHHPPSNATAGHPFHVLADRGIDVILAGHAHLAHVELIHGRHHANNCLMVQATTACSTRLRDDANGYGLLHIDMPHIHVDIRGWNGDCFQMVNRHSYSKHGTSWFTARLDPAAETRINAAQ